MQSYFMDLKDFEYSNASCTDYLYCTFIVLLDLVKVRPHLF